MIRGAAVSEFLPALMAAGVALTIINSKAVLEALCGYQTSFARTPKYAIGGSQRVMLATLSIAMRYAGPKAALFLAIVRKNYGCSHYIVGRDGTG